MFQNLLREPNVKVIKDQPSISVTQPDGEPLLGSSYRITGSRQIENPHYALDITNGSFSWNLKGENVVLSNINIIIPRGKMSEQ